MIRQNGLFTSDEMTKSTRSLHTPSIFAKQNLLYVQEVGFLQSLQPHKCVREELDSFLFLIVLEGKGKLTIQKHSFEISKGDCAFIDCMEHYEHISDVEAAWKLAWVHFNGHAARGYCEQFLRFNGNGNAFHVDDADKWFAIIQEIIELQKAKSVMAEFYTSELLFHLLNNAMASVAGAAIRESTQDNLDAEDIREFINERYDRNDVLIILAHEFEKTADVLNDIFFHAYGISIVEYIGNRRYNAAKELLRFSVKPMDVVARESGIGDIIAMQEMFHSREEMSAEEYRQKWAGWVRN